MNAKQFAGEQAVSYVKDGMKIGLGTGSTVYFSILKIGQQVREGLRIEAIPTSRATEKLAKEEGIPLTDFDQCKRLDLTIDGADEIDSHLQLIKGGGGALFREKLVASASGQLIIVADESKDVGTLGAFPLPVEVTPFAWQTTSARIEELGCLPQLRMKEDKPFITDNGNFIVDCRFEAIANPAELDKELNAIIGVVEHGLFVNMVNVVLLGRSSGEVTIRERGF
jgi:ribose 5-phosphate isomerase A